MPKEMRCVASSAGSSARRTVALLIPALGRRLRIRAKPRHRAGQSSPDALTTFALVLITGALAARPRKIVGPGLASPVAPSVARSPMIERPVTSAAAPLGSIAGQP